MANEVFAKRTEVKFDGGRVKGEIAHCPMVDCYKFDEINVQAKCLFDRYVDILIEHGESVEAAADNACSIARKFIINRMEERGYILIWK